MLNENISEQNAFIRLICGVSMTSFGIGRIARNPNCKIGHSMIFLGAMKIAEGTFLYCPLKAMIGTEEQA